MYFARIESGTVIDVRRVTAERVATYPGVWVHAPDETAYPGIGWAWTEAGGFVAPPPEPEMMEPAP